MSRLSVGSLFSGIGGLDLGLERAGMEVRWQVEIDPYCQRVLAKHWPDVPRYGDIKTIDWTEVKPVDLICGGFPCQPVSLAGKRLAQDDERWLWPEFARCLRVLRPRFALLENVPGLLSAGMSDVLGDLAESGYDAEWDCIPAAAVGAPHLRKRVWLLAHARCESRGVRVCGIYGRHELVQQGTDRAAEEWSDDRKLCPLVPGVCQGVVKDWWRAQSRVDRSAHGVPSRVDRLRGLGNAVVPQVAEWIGRRIMEVAA